MHKPFLAYGKQNITDEDVAVVVDALKSDFLTTGPAVEAFEKIFADYVGSQHAVAVANGTAALHLAALALGLGDGDMVLAPSMSFVGSANGARYTGANIEFMDCDPDSGLITVETFVEAAERADRAGRPAKMAVIVHLNGEYADMAAIASEAQKRGIVLVEDACHALGTDFGSADESARRVGSCPHSVMACFSMHPVKTITTGEGGMVTTNDPALDRKLKLLRSHGIDRDPEQFSDQGLGLDANGDPNPWFYDMNELGFNYRLTDIACALGISQMNRMDEIAARRRDLKARYDELFSKSNLPMKPVSTRGGTDPVRHLYPLLVEFSDTGITRSNFSAGLRELGIGTQVHYIPAHRLHYYRVRNPSLKLPGAEKYYDRVISIPFYPTLQDDDPERVMEAIREVWGI